jgi:hypothetical protein
MASWPTSDARLSSRAGERPSLGGLLLPNQSLVRCGDAVSVARRARATDARRLVQLMPRSNLQLLLTVSSRQRALLLNSISVEVVRKQRRWKWSSLRAALSRARVFRRQAR